jgi:hypothetical protein
MNIFKSNINYNIYSYRILDFIKFIYKYTFKIKYLYNLIIISYLNNTMYKLFKINIFTIYIIIYKLIYFVRKHNY